MKIFSFLFILYVFGNEVKSQELHLYAGQNHDEYIGCLNCNQFDSNSIWNEFGNYGSIFSGESIWNEFGNYGSEFSSKSPWNEFTSTPPVIVDLEGNFYGYLTVNKSKSDRANFDLVKVLYEYHEFIREDLNKWYEKIFQ